MEKEATNEERIKFVNEYYAGLAELGDIDDQIIINYRKQHADEVKKLFGKGNSQGWLEMGEFYSNYQRSQKEGKLVPKQNEGIAKKVEEGYIPSSKDESLSVDRRRTIAAISGNALEFYKLCEEGGFEPEQEYMDLYVQGANEFRKFKEGGLEKDVSSDNISIKKAFENKGIKYPFDKKED